MQITQEWASLFTYRSSIVHVDGFFSLVLADATAVEEEAFTVADEFDRPLARISWIRLLRSLR